jgi:hypothetical protein
MTTCPDIRIKPLSMMKQFRQELFTFKIVRRPFEENELARIARRGVGMRCGAGYDASMIHCIR